jgi:PHD/YefM family antitoxin component YafN of YafNO toxin-antitoxin module
MPLIIPIRDLKNTSEISQKCHSSDEPIFVTKNGYGDMVIMSMEMYEEKMMMIDIYTKLKAAEEQLTEGKVTNAESSLDNLRENIRLVRK